MCHAKHALSLILDQIKPCFNLKLKQKTRWEFPAHIYIYILKYKGQCLKN